MALHPDAGKKAPTTALTDVARLENAFFTTDVDVGSAAQMVNFGTSGHRGTSLDGTFCEAHILAVTQAICDYRKEQKVDGPLFLGKDTHDLSRLAQRIVLEVLAANEVHAVLQEQDGYTPTPVISYAILHYNRGRRDHKADGIILTPSHNPPQDGGIKYNGPNGGPADTDVTTWIQERANQYLRGKNADVRKVPYANAIRASSIHQQNLMRTYVAHLQDCIDLEAIRRGRVKIGVDPLGGSSLHCWEMIAEQHGLDISLVNKVISPKFEFMPLDHDGQIRMDCSSPHAMANLVALKDSYAIAIGNDPDADRHGIVTPAAGLMNPNHYLAVAIRYLFTYRTRWRTDLGIGKTLVSSGIIDRVAQSLGRRVVEVPVGFKWFVPGLYDGTLGFGGEESAGASFLGKDGAVWTTDKDGILLGLLAAEMLGRTGVEPGIAFQEIVKAHGQPFYQRQDEPATLEQKNILKKLTDESVQATTLAGEPIQAKLTRAPGNNAPIGGLKVTAANGWFAARPSGTENVYKIYAESFIDQDHLDQILAEARAMVAAAFALGS